MATIGERIQRARVARRMSGEELARAVGYKQQSGISNLENRGGGTGGKKLPEIARVLRVPLEWLMEGPDDTEVPFSEPMARDDPSPTKSFVAREQIGRYQADASLQEAVDLFKRLKTEQRVQVIRLMHQLLNSGLPEAHKERWGKVIPFPTTRQRSP